MNQRSGSRRAIVLLLAGAAVGITLAATGLLSSRSGAQGALPDNAVARVNGQAIRLQEYQRVLSGLAQDAREPPGDGERRHVLDRLIDEELLVQRGLELGIARDDSRVRKDLTAAVIDSVVAELADAQPSDGELQQFYDGHRDFFTAPGRLRVRQIFCRVAATTEVPPALERAQQAAARLRAGEEFATVRTALGDAELAPLPDTSLPPAKLVDYLGPTAARTALSLEVGGVSDPVRSSNGVHVLQVLERQPDTTPPLDAIRAQVVAEFRRHASEQALRTYLDDLRARADIAVTSHLP